MKQRPLLAALFLVTLATVMFEVLHVDRWNSPPGADTRKATASLPRTFSSAASGACERACAVLARAGMKAMA